MEVLLFALPLSNMHHSFLYFFIVDSNCMIQLLHFAWFNYSIINVVQTLT